MGAAAALAAWAAVTWLTGGFILHVGAVSISSRDPVRPLILALVLYALAWRSLPRHELIRHARMLGADRKADARIALAASICVLIVAVAWNTRASGGSDSSCYLLQADAFARGDLFLRDPLASSAPFPNAAAMFAPTGWAPSPTEPLAAVPICAPGLALAMAAATIVAGRDAAILIVPLLAAAAVWTAFLLGRRLDSPASGAAAAVLTACSPIFLYQAVQPMSDVPATTLWLATLVACLRRTPAGDAIAGACAALAVLTRPNLALIIVPLVMLMLSHAGTSWKQRAARIVRFGAAAAPLLLLLAWINQRRYGFALASGYGDTRLLFDVTHLWPNLLRYPRWLIATETPFILLAIAAPWWAWRRTRDTVNATLAILLSAGLLLATYLAYVVFDDWWYIRFLLPAIPALLVLSVAVTADGLRLAMPRWRRLALAGSCGALAGWYLHVAQTHDVFALQSLESRFVVAGQYAARALPSRAVVLSVQQSGSVRYHGHRSTLAWDAVQPTALDATIAWLTSEGRPAYVAVEENEESRFRQRFVGQRYGALDWPPKAEIHTAVRVRIYDVADRDRYQRGERLSIEHIR